MRRADTEPLLPFLIAIGVLLHILSWCEGCSSAPDALRLAVVANNQAAHEYRAAVARHEAALEADIRARVSVCAGRPDRGACVQSAALEAYDATETERSELTVMGLVQQAAADALQAAAQCRIDGADCEARELARAEEELAKLRARIRRLK